MATSAFDFMQPDSKDVSNPNIKRFKLDPNNLTQMSQAQLDRLDAMGDDDIDYTDMPEISASTIGTIYRPIKKTITIRLDADVPFWFKGHHDKYQTEVNRILRDHMVSSIEGDDRSAIDEVFEDQAVALEAAHEDS